MRKLFYYSMLLVSSVVLFSACATQKTAYTYQMYQSNQWTEYDLRQMKFYLSDEIVLGREIKKHKTSIRHGKIKKVNGQWMEEITIPKGSVGILVKQPRSTQLLLRFNDCEKCALVFQRKSRKDGRYILHTRGSSHKRGQVKMNGNTYVASSNSRETYLLVKMKQVSDRRTRKYELETAKR